MSYVYVLTQTAYKHYEDYENEEYKDLDVLYVYTTANLANEAAKEWVEENYSDGDNEVEQNQYGCDTWTCTLQRDEQSHVVITVERKDLFGEPEDSEVNGEEDEQEEGDEDATGQDTGSIEAQEPPAKRVRQA